MCLVVAAGKESKVNMNKVLKTIEERSSIRSYTTTKLTDEEIRMILNAGLQAPTARNEQEIHISILAGDHPVLKEIDDEKKALQLIDVDEEKKKGILNNIHNFYYEAPTVFILSADKDFPWSQVDAGIAVENMTLAAQSLGLGSVIIGIIKKAMLGDKKDYFANICQFPENYEFMIALAVGHPNANKKQHTFDFDKLVKFITDDK